MRDQCFNLSPSHFHNCSKCDQGEPQAIGSAYQGPDQQVSGCVEGRHYDVRAFDEARCLRSSHPGLGRDDRQTDPLDVYRATVLTESPHRDGWMVETRPHRAAGECAWQVRPLQNLAVPLSSRPVTSKLRSSHVPTCASEGCRPGASIRQSFEGPVPGCVYPGGRDL